MDRQKEVFLYLKKYKKRSPEFKNVFYLRFLRYFNFTTISRIAPRPRVLLRVLNYFSRYKPSQKKNYARVKFILYKSFRNIAGLLRIKENTPFKIFYNTFLYWQEIHSYNVEPDFLEELPPNQKNEFEDREQKEESV